MQTKHTPGPWRADSDPYRWSIKGPDGTSICACSSNVQREPEAKLANCRLVQHAPDLLEVCDVLTREARNLVELLDNGHDHREGDTTENVRLMIAAASDLVRRVKGETDQPAENAADGFTTDGCVPYRPPAEHTADGPPYDASSATGMYDRDC